MLLEGTIVRTAFPILRKYVLPVARKVRKDVIESAVLKTGICNTWKDIPQESCKENSQKTVRKQMGRGKKGTSKNRMQNRRKIIKSKNRKQRSREDFFKNIT